MSPATLERTVGYKQPAVDWNAVTPPAARDLGHAVAEFLLAVAA